MIRVGFDDLLERMLGVLLGLGFEEARAALCARLFAETSLDGGYSHGLNRFLRFVEYVNKGFIDIGATPVRIGAPGVLEVWDGRLGPGNLNAYACMGRAIEIARRNGMGCVALRNTNHWMRGGSYGIQAAEADCIGICWTNTMPNLPSWGARSANLGNNPLILAVPCEGCHVILDMAMSQFSYGKMESYRSAGELLPVEGGYDGEGRLSRDPGAILDSMRPLPIGFWKGSGLSFLLDLVAMALSGGSSVAEVGKREAELGLSQVYIAFDPARGGNGDALRGAVESAVAAFHEALPDREGGRVYYPGERMKAAREENLRLGIPVDEGIWDSLGRL
jgi:3-dehydro-L-gulonate 2-dehydrogenase